MFCIFSLFINHNIKYTVLALLSTHCAYLFFLKTTLKIYILFGVEIKIKKRVPVREVKIFKRKRVDQSVQFRIIYSLQCPN